MLFDQMISLQHAQVFLKSQSLLDNFLSPLVGSVSAPNGTIPPTMDRGVSDTSTREAETRGGGWVGGCLGNAGRL